MDRLAIYRRDLQGLAGDARLRNLAERRGIDFSSNDYFYGKNTSDVFERTGSPDSSVALWLEIVVPLPPAPLRVNAVAWARWSLTGGRRRVNVPLDPSALPTTIEYVCPEVELKVTELPF